MNPANYDPSLYWMFDQPMPHKSLLTKDGHGEQPDAMMRQPPSVRGERNLGTLRFLGELAASRGETTLRGDPPDAGEVSDLRPARGRR